MEPKEKNSVELEAVLKQIVNLANNAGVSGDVVLEIVMQ